MDFLKRVALAVLIVIGILWVVYVMGCGDYREPREVIADEQSLKCSRCGGYAWSSTWLAQHNCWSSSIRGANGEGYPELQGGFGWSDERRQKVYDSWYKKRYPFD